MLALSLPFSPVFAEMSLAFGTNHLEAPWSGPEYRPGTWIPLDPLTWLLKIHIKITTLNRSNKCKWCKWAIFHSYVSLPEVYILQDLFCWHRKTMEVPMMLVVFVKGGTFLTSQAYAVCRYTYLRNLCVCVHRTQLRRIVRSGKVVTLTSVHEGCQP